MDFSCENAFQQNELLPFFFFNVLPSFFVLTLGTSIVT